MNDKEWECVVVSDADEVLEKLIEIMESGVPCYNIDVFGTSGDWQVWMVKS